MLIQSLSGHVAVVEKQDGSDFYMDLRPKVGLDNNLLGSACKDVLRAWTVRVEEILVTTYPLIRLPPPPSKNYSFVLEWYQILNLHV